MTRPTLRSSSHARPMGEQQGSTIELNVELEEETVEAIEIDGSPGEMEGLVTSANGSFGEPIDPACDPIDPLCDLIDPPCG